MRSETKIKKSASSAIPVITIIWVVASLVHAFFDETITGGKVFFKVAFAIVLGFATFAILTAWEDRSSKKKQ